MKIIKKIIGNIVIITALCSVSVKADVIDIEIIGQGTISSVEASINCTESCSIDNQSQTSRLVAHAENNWKFNGWSGQQCDAGNGVLVNSSSLGLVGALGGAKTLDSADINGDGISDLAIISLFDGKVSTLTNDGSGRFDKALVASDLNYPSALSFYDWDNDGDQDLIVAVFGNRKLKLYLNDGNGELLFSNDIVIGSIRPYSIAVLDVNNDQAPDLVVSSFSADTTGDLFALVDSISSAKTEVYLNENNIFTLDQTLSENAAITLDAYLTADSSLVVVAAEIVEKNIALYQNSTRTVIDANAASYGVAFGDIDNNGTMDILAANYRPSTLALYIEQGNYNYSSAQIIAKPEEGLTATAIVDIDADGYADIATGEFNAKQFYYFKTLSYKDCIVYQGSDISLTAEFIQTASAIPTPAPTAPSENKNSSSSGGGSLSWFLLLIVALTANKKLKLTR
jgi:hypothetical protein